MALDRKLSKGEYKSLISIYDFFNMFNIPTLKKNTNKTTLGSSSHTSQDENRKDNEPCRGFEQREALTLSVKM